MYKLGDQFKMDVTKGVADKSNIFVGNKYRITVLTERLLRLEYSLNGEFEDSLTSLIQNRKFPKVTFTKEETDSVLKITTKYFTLTYTKDKPFIGTKVNPSINLKVELKSNKRSWYYGHPEVRNYGIPKSLMETNEMRERKGLYSEEGFASINDTNNFLLNEDGTYLMRKKGNIDIYLFMYGNDFEEALKDYYLLTGYPALIPRYALGNWWSRNLQYDDISLKKVVDTFKEKQVPLSIILLDKDWHKRKLLSDEKEKIKKYSKSGFSFNEGLFETPKSMIDYLHKEGIRIGLNVNPVEGIYDIENNFDEALKYIEKKENMIPFNAFSPKFIDVYLKIFIHPLDDMGIDFYWLDTYESNRLREISALRRYQFLDMKRNYKRRPLILSNDVGVAPHRYPVLYSGKSSVSWSTLRNVAKYNILSANNGVSFWAHDIGGYFKGMEDSELYIRFVQLGVFSPILKFGSDKGKYYKREPWRWEAKTYSITRNYLTLRHKLIPYIYSEAYKYHKEGKLLIKPIYYDIKKFYDDAIYRNEYYFGENLFVCPILTKEEKLMSRVIQKFYLPKGMWYDFVTGKKFPGEKDHTAFFKEDEYPVFAKSGAIIPVGLNETLNDTKPPKNMEIHIFPGQSNTYMLFEDDGESDLYRKDFYIKTSFDYNYMPNNYSIIVRSEEGKSGIIPDTRNYKFIFRNTKKAEDVSVYFNRDKIDFNSHTDGTNFIVEVSEVNTIGQITVNCKGKDIEIDAVRIINNEIEDIINDLAIETRLKDKIDRILFSDKTIKTKRIEIRKLGKEKLEHKFIQLFLKLLEYIEEI